MESKKYYRYSLDKSSKKYVCPNCQRKTFVLFIDNETGEPLNADVGKCDRADNCGFMYTPKQYFADNPTAGNAQQEHRPRPVVRRPPPPPPDYVDLEIVLKHYYKIPYDTNTLFCYLASVFGNEATRAAFTRYGVGTAKDGATIFWQWDERLRVRTGKIMHYKPDGHRDHDRPPQWVHTRLKPDYNLKQCLFGLNLITKETQKVAIVESEKTAIVASICLPQYVWLATGGVGNLQPEKFNALRGKDVVLWPDLQAADKWKAAAELLRPICSTVTVTDFLEHRATDKAREKGLDLADYLIDHKKGNANRWREPDNRNAQQD